MGMHGGTLSSDTGRRRSFAAGTSSLLRLVAASRFPASVAPPPSLGNAPPGAFGVQVAKDNVRLCDVVRLCVRLSA